MGSRAIWIIRRTGRPLGAATRVILGGTAIAAVLAAVGLAAGPGSGRDAPDEWTELVEAADRREPAAAPGDRARRLAPRTAYLLAFHRAQDAGDPEHVLAVADRLDGLGEPALARHVRAAAALLVAELGAPAERTGPPPEP